MIRNKEKIYFDIKKLLTSQGLRWTEARKLVLRAFLNHQEPLTPGEILVIVGESKVNFSSVYRAIELFCEQRILALVDAVGEGKRFVLSDAYREHCHYLVCLKCGNTQVFNSCFIHELEEKVGQEFNFSVASHELKLTGFCKKCR